jgi:hypothetical protein
MTLATDRTGYLGFAARLNLLVQLLLPESRRLKQSTVLAAALCTSSCPSARMGSVDVDSGIARLDLETSSANTLARTFNERS